MFLVVLVLGFFALYKILEFIEDKDYEANYKRKLRMQKKYGKIKDDGTGRCSCRSPFCIDCEDQRRGY